MLCDVKLINSLEHSINHPIAVANFLASTGITDMDVLQAAVLHDTVEDTHTTIEEITRKFGARVASIVKVSGR